MQGFAQNRIWCLIVALACDLLAFSQLLALTSTPARTWEPRTIRLRLMSIPAVITHHARRTVLRYKTEHPWTSLLLDGLGHLQALTGSIDTRLLPPVHHAPEGRTLWPPERPDHRETTRGKPSHPTGIINPTTPATTPPKPTQPDDERSRLIRMASSSLLTAVCDWGRSRQE
ncbi:hypothetical protein ATCC27039_21370 [Actinomyces naeslundii]|nr:hypothetical protein ATCC27039_21370 [Actinomyces naeslundii]